MYAYMKFKDAYDVDHFIDYLKDDVCIVRETLDRIVNKDLLYNSHRCVYCYIFSS